MQTDFWFGTLFRSALPLLAALSFAAVPAAAASSHKAGDIQIDTTSTVTIKGVPVEYELGTCLFRKIALPETAGSLALVLRA